MITTALKEDFDFLRGIGADQVIDHKDERLEEQLSDLDVVFDLIGGETQDRSWTVLKRGGVLVSTLGEPPRDKAQQHGARGVGYLAQPDADLLAQIGRLIEEERIKMRVAATYSLSEAGAAQDEPKNQHVQGKIVLDAAS